MQAFIEGAFQDAIRPRDVAHATGLSLAYAGTLFRRSTGKTLSEAITARRVDFAVRMLEHGGSDISMTKVALESGFGSVSRFYEAFRKATGTVPGDLLGRKCARQPGLRFVMWIDDQPNNNIIERRALAHMGVMTDTYLANDQAYEALQRMPYDLIISDLTRNGHRESGWDVATLAKGYAPLIYYTGRDDQVRRERARRAGALGLFAASSQLLDAVALALR